MRIIRTYGAAGHDKEVIDSMSSFGAKNVLRRDTVTHDAFFKSEGIADYLKVKNPHYYYKNISVKTVATASMGSNISMEIPGCMKQRFMLFTPNCSVTCQEYLCDCVSCLQFKLDGCFKEQDGADFHFSEDLEGFEDDECDKDIDQIQKNFDFVVVPSFVSLFTRNPENPCYIYNPSY